MKKFLFLIAVAGLLSGCITECEDPTHMKPIVVNSPHVYTVVEKSFFHPRYSPTIYNYTLLDEKGRKTKIESFTEYAFGDKLVLEIKRN